MNCIWIICPQKLLKNKMQVFHLIEYASILFNKTLGRAHDLVIAWTLPVTLD